MMKKKLLVVLVPLAITASCGTSKKEVKVTPNQEVCEKQKELSVKYEKTLNEIDALKEKLQEVQKEKEDVSQKVSYLEQQISALEAEKASLQQELSTMPSRQELEQELQMLEAQVGGEQ